LFAALFIPACVYAEDHRGEQIYRQRCASCHGKEGEGTDENYAKPLAGERTTTQLAKLIAKTMPKDDEKKCTAEEAEKVAAYIYDAFYSKAAQDRNKPPRIELSRLTVRQYRNAVADVIGSFPKPSPDIVADLRGLQGDYFKLYGFRSRNHAFARVDDEIRFDFGEASPDMERMEPDRFCIRWGGSVLAPETGEYEFIVRTEHSAKLYINDLKKPLIDAFVKSSNDTEHRGSIFLLGGRVYALRLEFAKGKQGDIDGKKDQTKPPPVKASVALEWKLPSRAAEPIPGRFLRRNHPEETFIVSTPFSADDRTLGYERGTSISKAWDQATTDAALAAADFVVRHLDALAGIKKEAPDVDRVREFCLRFAERAFRRPWAGQQDRLYALIHDQFDGGRSLEDAVRRVVLLVLKSPRFLYREISPTADAYDTASRLSFAIWDSIPDSLLLEAAAKGELATPEQVAREAERMTADSRARAKIRDFFFQWLKVEQAPDLSKDTKQFPEFDKAVASDLRTSLDLFLDDVVWSESSDFRQLFLADYLYLNGRLSRLYGGDLPADAPFRKVTGKSGERAGILSHPYLMSTFAYTAASSPIHRGVFLARNILGQVLRPPQDAFAPLSADLHPNLTTRERVTLQTKPQACLSCHGMINPLGFTLENFDAVGRYRDQERGKSIDAKGSYETRAGKTVTFNGLRDLATFLANSEETHDAFVERMFHFMVKQPVRAFGPRKLDNLCRSFADNEYNMRKLVTAIVTEAALYAPNEKPKTATGRQERSIALPAKP
jgi:cytochrome c553